LRSCGNKPTCNNRTNAQPFHDGVGGIKWLKMSMTI
jgi:hypothetical protein